MCPTPHKTRGWGRRRRRAQRSRSGQAWTGEEWVQDVREGLIRCSLAMARPHWGLSLHLRRRRRGRIVGARGCRKTPPERLKRNHVKQTRILPKTDDDFSNVPSMADGPQFTEIVALLAEILVLDYQEHKKITVGSPLQSNRNAKLNSLRLVQDEE
jgi:hypothetical protein